MPRKRMIDPGIWSDKKMVRLDLPSFTVFVGLMSLADDEGIKEVDPLSLHYELARKDLTSEMIACALQELAKAGLIELYGEDYVFLPKWFKHQKLKYPTQTKLHRPPAEVVRRYPEYISEWERIFRSEYPFGDDGGGEYRPELEPVPGGSDVDPPESVKDSPSPYPEPSQSSVNTQEGLQESSPSPPPALPIRLGKDRIDSEEDTLSGKAPTEAVEEIVSYLNEATGKSFKPDTKDTLRHINGRWKEGHRVPSFKAVIDNRVGKWGHDSKMKEFLRPSTLFGPKFESYLNSSPAIASPGWDIPERMTKPRWEDQEVLHGCTTTG